MKSMVEVASAAVAREKNPPPYLGVAGSFHHLPKPFQIDRIGHLLITSISWVKMIP
ncbi:hypothetical protein SAMN05444487_10667 [Marininema mesophilum]|uniref:Uncharacterized protein n=1 Tax=Marininema mesophilum TaxID=1048340 RepID=A0A1H2WAL7_9BACL|nr:hypothetical protein SAMN05444487_10667 [Marininema mesophilum]